MAKILSNGLAKHILAEEDHLLQGFLLDAPHKTFDVRCQIRRPWRQPDGLYALIFQALAKRFTELRISVHDQISLAQQEPVERVREIPGNLFHPWFVWIHGATGEMNPTRRPFHDEQQIVGDQATNGPHFDRGEVDRGQDVPVGFDEGLPRCLSFAIRCWFDSVLLKVTVR